MTEPIEIADGPTYDHGPNYLRRVVVEREADVPGFVRCRDVETGAVLIVHRSKLPPSAEA